MVAVIGGVLGFSLAHLVRWVLHSVGAAGATTDEPTFAVYMTAIAAGGAAALTLRNLEYRRREAARDRRRLLDDQFARAVELLGSGSELEAIAGAALLGSTLRSSPEHAQPSANILCAALRMPRAGDVDDQTLAIDPPGLAATRASDSRIRDALSRAIAAATKTQGAPAHLEHVVWDFSACVFGEWANFDGCTFGGRTVFHDSVFASLGSFWGTRFAAGATFDRVRADEGLFLRGVDAGGTLEFYDCQLGHEHESSNYGIYLMDVVSDGVTVKRVTSVGPFALFGSDVAGDVHVEEAQFGFVGLDASTADGRITLVRIACQSDLWLNDVAARKTVTVRGCTGVELSTRGVRADGAVHIEGRFFEKIAGDHAREEH